MYDELIVTYVYVEWCSGLLLYGFVYGESIFLIPKGYNNMHDLQCYTLLDITFET